ncbi:hypothetical protein [Flammeovirga kamogawensis]|uniref:DUF3575 domain-containing protein n=1 Tax=Flammeovirga kamogawensis TaxID=373891 RepID=A0ABX8H1Q0_9BACT|nr:hypothetical protein [Flammeovirga kamogawensis]MBB6462249.1 hypothetical protein [Flammeovirga kamogawensis]QWG09351.1 hypothetical protein KM029_22355 [Flammeovirga kamogawensis]TRX64873.1 hypothetical protein EO216_20270 [Flammeovirga kamogawensis]
MRAYNLLFLFILFFINISNGQEIERSTFGLQVGVLGVWVNHEYKLIDRFILRTEVGLDSYILSKTPEHKSNLQFSPVVTLEPRWYYNLTSRKKKEKHILRNSANFFSLKSSYHPDWFVISNQDNLIPISDISIVPSWGMRRHIGQHINYEVGLGIGYIRTFYSNTGFGPDEEAIDINLNIRIGYSIF